MTEFEIEHGSQGEQWESRFQKSHDDRVVLARFLAACLVVIAVVNVVPAAIYWYRWSEAEIASALPRWVYLQVFASLLHLVYAVFLVQISDWASLRAVSWAMLAVAMAFGLLSTGLIVGDGSGFVPEFLELQGPLVKRAGFWCVAMLCVATLASYLGGRESARWQRAEELLFSMKDNLAKNDD